MDTKFNELKINFLEKEELLKIDGGGAVWKWLGKVTGNIKNAVVSYYENWMEMPAMPY